MQALEPKDLYAIAKREHPHDRKACKEMLDRLLIEYGYKQQPPTEAERPTMSVAEAAHALRVSKPRMINLCKTKKVAARGDVTDAGSRRYRPYVDEVQRLKEARDAQRAQGRGVSGLPGLPAEPVRVALSGGQGQPGGAQGRP